MMHLYIILGYGKVPNKEALTASTTTFFFLLTATETTLRLYATSHSSSVLRCSASIPTHSCSLFRHLPLLVHRMSFVISTSLLAKTIVISQFEGCHPNINS